MNFKFNVIASGFEKAAKIEKALKAVNATYRVEMIQPPKAAKKKKRAVVSKQKVDSILDMTKKGFSVAKIMNLAGVSRATVGRVQSGTHALQKRKLKAVK